MYKKKILVWISLIGVAIGSYFVYNFYVTFFWDNTVFENDSSFVFIDRDDTIDSLQVQLNPLLKSTSNFRVAADKKGYSKTDLLHKNGKYLDEIVSFILNKRNNISK